MVQGRKRFEFNKKGKRRLINLSIAKKPALFLKLGRFKYIVDLFSNRLI